VAATCGKCHRFIEQRLQASVHGGGGGPGGGGGTRGGSFCLCSTRGLNAF